MKEFTTSATCPRCLQESTWRGDAAPLVQLSRVDDTTLICAACGAKEDAIWIPLVHAAMGSRALVLPDDAHREFVQRLRAEHDKEAP